MKKSYEQGENIENETQSRTQEVKKDEKGPKPEHPPKKKEICLVFIVNGSPYKMEANIEWHLRKAVELALRETGNEGRPLSDWSVKWNNQVLDMNQKIEEFNFPECAELFLSLNAGQGG